MTALIVVILSANQAGRTNSSGGIGSDGDIGHLCVDENDGNRCCQVRSR